MKFFRVWIFASCACASCASYPYVNVDGDVHAGRFSDALGTLEKGEKRYGGDSVLFYLDAGLIAHYAGKYKESSFFLEEGERAIEAAFTKSISESAASFVANDTVKEYAGEDYEDLYINIFNALNYYHADNVEDAMVEVRRLEEKLRGLAVRYNQIEEKIEEEGGEVAASKKKADFANSAAARYLGVLFYRALGRPDDARIDRDMLKRAYKDYKDIYNHPLPSTIDDELKIPKDSARLNIIAFAGLAPKKTERLTRVPVSSRNWIKIAVPDMVKQESEVGSIEVRFQKTPAHTPPGGFKLELLEDIRNVAVETFRKKQSLIEAKAVIRSTIKTAAAAGFSAAGESQNNAGLSLIGLSLQLLAEASERADIRAARFFPARIYAGGITLPPGAYTFTVRYYSSAGHEIASFEYKDYEVKKNALNLIETHCLR